MCLYTKWRYPRLAWRPIKVIKLLQLKDGDIVTPYRYHKVESEVLKCHKFQWIPKKDFYLKDNASIRMVECAIHTYDEPHMASLRTIFPANMYMAVKATIPRFAWYYRSNGGEYASTRIILDKDYKNEAANRRQNP